MGLDAKAVQFLLAVRALGVSFDRTATIGRQHMLVTASWLHRSLRRSGFDVDRRVANRLLSESGGFADSFLRLLGASDVVSLDASDYEGAVRILDLNEPIPADLDGAFTAVIDAGSLEHIFDFPTALRNCMRMVAVDGHFLAVTPANNWAGHGFYQFSPELFHEALAPQSGFRVERMLLTERPSGRWYEVDNPAAVGDRVQFTTFRPVYLCVVARRVADRPVLASPPEQSDHVRMWQDAALAGGSGESGDDRDPLERYLPDVAARAWWQRHSARAALRALERYAPDVVVRACWSLLHLARATVLPFDRRSVRRVDIANLKPREKRDAP